MKKCFNSLGNPICIINEVHSTRLSDFHKLVTAIFKSSLYKAIPTEMFLGIIRIFKMAF